MNRSFMHDFMNPASVAVVGAGNNPMKMGTMHALSILKDGFSGRFYPVHPREKTVLGHKAYASALDLPEAPDLALFVLPAAHLISVFEDFGRIGTRYAIVVTAGFKEIGPDGERLEQQLVGIARKYGMRFIGPNCMGIINRDIKLNTTVSRIVGKSGGLALISQSGTYVAQTAAFLEKRGIRLGKAVSVGNEADVNITDVLEYLGEDDNTRAIAIYIETIRDVRRFLDVASKITPRKPVIAQYIGGSEAGARAGKSHTGAMAGKNHLYDGLFAQAGIMRVFSVEDLYGIGWALATQPRIRGNRIAIITNSGGPGSAMADTLDAMGCKVPEFSTDLKEKIKPMLEPHAPCGNPVDFTFALDMPAMTETVPELVAKSGEVDGICLHGAMAAGFLRMVFPHFKDLLGGASLDEMLAASEKDLSGLGRIPVKYGIPMTVSSFFGQEDNYTKAYQENDIPVFDSPEKAARAMAALYHYARISKRKTGAPKLPAGKEAASEIISRAMKRGDAALDEHESKQVLSAYGIAVPDEILARSAEETEAAAQKIGFPVAVKACHPQILHKTEKNLVHLNVGSGREAAEAFDEIQANAGFDTPVLVSRMMPGKREFLVGTSHDPQFGHCVAFGLGGIFTEAMADITYRLAPVSHFTAKEMAQSIRAYRLLEAYRNMPACDMDLLAELIVSVSAIPVLHEEIREIDINPVIISEGRPVAVDALITLAN